MLPPARQVSLSAMYFINKRANNMTARHNKPTSVIAGRPQLCFCFSSTKDCALSWTMRSCCRRDWWQHRSRCLGGPRFSNTCTQLVAHSIWNSVFFRAGTCSGTSGRCRNQPSAFSASGSTKCLSPSWQEASWRHQYISCSRWWRTAAVTGSNGEPQANSVNSHAGTSLPMWQQSHVEAAILTATANKGYLAICGTHRSGVIKGCRF